MRELAGGTVVVKWEPPLEGACPVLSYNVYHREVFSREEKGKWNKVTVNRNTTNYTFYLNCWKEYEIVVTSVNTNEESAFNDSEVWKFRTRGGRKNIILNDYGTVSC